MSFQVFRGQGALAPHGRLQPLPSLRKALTDAAGYICPPGLADAVNVALALGMPLLVTGEPGTGKTQLAYRLAAELGLGAVLRFDTKSSSVAGELFYQFDSVSHFSDAQIAAVSGAGGQAARPEREFVRYRALGEAILASLPWSQVEELVSSAQADELKARAGQRSVVLIDEVDKAPRDFPNDLLNQIEELSFDIPELKRHAIRADADLRPIVIITSNSEKQLPEPFLRRCVYHHIEFPEAAQARREFVEQIVQSRLKSVATQGQSGYEAAVAAYFALRDDAQVGKKPSTSELLDWMTALHAAGVDWNRPLVEQPAPARRCIGTLAKNEGDKARLLQHLGLPGHPGAQG